MKKQPKLILRESAVWGMIKNFIPVSFVGVGAGAGRMVQTFCRLQRWFYRWDLGDGLVIVAKKP